MASGITLVLVTHDEREVSSLAEEVFEMSEGKLARAAPIVRSNATT